jgi:hypothetical protein
MTGSQKLARSSQELARAWRNLCGPIPEFWATSPVSAGLFWCLVFDVFLAQFDLKQNQSKLFAAAARRYARSGASSVAERARPDHLRRSVNLSAATCCRISSRDIEGPVRLRILLAVIGTLSRCSAWMAASIVSIFHFGITWLVMIASHSAAHVSPSARASSKPR